MPSWRTMLAREPQREECLAVALRYVAQAAPALRPDLAEFAAESTVWDLFRSRWDGERDLPDEFYEWCWDDLAAHRGATSDSRELRPCFQLADLIKVRVRAWVTFEVSATAPAAQAARTAKQRLAWADERWQAAQMFDADAWRLTLEGELHALLGSDWRSNKAAVRVRDLLFAKVSGTKKRTVEELCAEMDWQQDRYTLRAEACEQCLRLGMTRADLEPKEAALPPFHLTCSCDVHWQHDWVYAEREIRGRNLDAEVDAWVAKNIKGMSISVPTLADWITFEEARMHDETQQSNCRTVASPDPGALSL